MPFVKLDCGILNSTLWFEREAREVFLTALLMAEPIELEEPRAQIHISSLELTGWSVPAGWYGFVPAAGVGILHRAKVPQDVGMIALELLGSPEIGSRSPEFDGRRLVRIDGGFIVLNYMKYRERDYTTAERSRRYRERIASRRDVTVSHRDITQAEAEDRSHIEEKIEPSRSPKTVIYTDEFGRFWAKYPRKTGKGAAFTAFRKIDPSDALLAQMLKTLAWEVNCPDWTRDGGQYIPHAATWLNQRRWEDEPFQAPLDTSKPKHETAAAYSRRSIQQVRDALEAGERGDTEAQLKAMK